MTSRIWILAGAVALVGGFTGLWLLQSPTPIPRNLEELTGNVQRGAYVARLSGCIACHTNFKAGGKVLAGGAEIATDFGSFYAPNITPHPEDGIGKWSLDDFATALTAGVTPKEGHPYFPSFPFPFYTRLKSQDIVDLWAAVRSVPPVKGGPPEHDLKFPFAFRQGVALWDRLFFDQGEIEDVPDKSQQWNRGRYLAEGPAHCGACHTPRNFLGGRISQKQYEGGIGPGGEKIPPITPSALQKKKWTAEDLAYAFRTGLKPDGDAFGGSMAEVVQQGTRFWANDDISALVEYLSNPGTQKGND